MPRWTDAATVIIPSFLLLAACAGTRSDLPIDAGSGPNPTLPQPEEKAIPTVNVAPAKGWSGDQTPTAAAGFAVASYAADLDHPRWLYVLPNGDVLVAETNAPADRPEDKKGIKGFFMKKAQAKAGAGVPSPNRITLLRDADGDGKAETRGVFLKDLNSPFGMALVRNNFYVANTDAVMRFEYRDGAFVGQHGSWNRQPLAGYRVIFVPFANGRPTGAKPEEILTGFVDKDENALGRPVGVAVDARGALLVADDVGNRIWRVTSTQEAISSRQ